MPVAGADLSKRLVPDELWQPAAPLLPSFAARPRGGGATPCDERAVFTAVVYTLTSGCAWWHLPPPFGTSPSAAHRRLREHARQPRPQASHPGHTGRPVPPGTAAATTRQTQRGKASGKRHRRTLFEPLLAPNTHSRHPTRRPRTVDRAPTPAKTAAHPGGTPRQAAHFPRAARSLLPRAGAARVKGGPQGHRRSRREAPLRRAAEARH
ncbi:transposase [Streptomyces sp. NPDC006654]|uniref:transposase n=1 Tax=Streptomyces sp. NPDC006654 TaxID=3156897 RepID=UPI0033E69DC2